MAAHQAPPLGFSRQEHWSGLPFPSPMHESEKWKWSRSVMSNSLQSTNILIKTKMSYMTQVSFFGNLHFWAMSWVCKRWLISDHLMNCWASLVAQTVKNLPAMQETWVQSLGREDPLEEGMANHPSILAWRIPMNRGSWWATVHGVTKSLTQLKQLSSSSSSRQCLSNILFLVIGVN